MNLTTTNITSQKANLNWDGYSCADYYKIQYRVKGAAKWLKKTTSDNTASFVLHGLEPATTYQWKVASVVFGNGTSIMSSFSVISTFTTTGAGFDIAGGNNVNADEMKQNSFIDNDAIIYPNPASTKFRVQLNSSDKAVKNDPLSSSVVSLVLKDVSGKIVWNSTNISFISIKAGIDVDVAKLPGGIYFLQIISGDNSLITKKVVIEK